MNKVLSGLDVLQQDHWKKLKGLRTGLLSNQASLDAHLKSTKEVISRLLPDQLKVLFGPQHGYGGEDQDGGRLRHEAADDEGERKGRQLQKAEAALERLQRDQTITRAA